MADIDYESVFGAGAGPGEPEGTPENEEPLEPEGERGDHSSEETEQEPPPEESEKENIPAEPSADSLRLQAEETVSQRLEKELGELLANTGLLDPYTQKPISSLADLRAYREHFEADKRREFQDGHGMTDEQYQAFVSDLPEVKAAREAAERAASEGAKARLEKDLKEVGKLDPSVKSLEDLAQRPEYPQICGMVEKGLSLPQAYKLVYFDQLSQRAAEAAKQGTLNSLAGREHLQKSTTRGEGAAPVPPSVAEEYRMFMPEATEAEIQAHYNAYAKAHMRQ